MRPMNRQLRNIGQQHWVKTLPSTVRRAPQPCRAFQYSAQIQLRVSQWYREDRQETSQSLFAKVPRQELQSDSKEARPIPFRELPPSDSSRPSKEPSPRLPSHDYHDANSHSVSSMSSPATKEFIPTTTYRAPSSIPRAWYHGHSEKATQTLSKLTHVSAVVSVRDMRIPLTSWNPTIDKDMLVSDANNRRRLIVYSKKDLCRDVRRLERRLCELHEKTDPGSDVFFFHERGPESEMHRLMSRIRELCVEDDSLTRSQVVITGLPNVGKSTLVNRMARCRLQGDKLQGIQREGRRNPAETGAQPGVTKHVQKQGIRIGLGQDDSEEAGSVEVDGLRSRVYAVDTPGIGVKYIPDGEEYLKLALCHSVGTNQGSLTHEVLAEYLLFRMNLHDPKCYSRYCSVPTNNVDEFLDAVRTSTGKRDDSHAAAFVVSKWREGRLGRFALDDDLSLEAFETRRARVLMGPMSGNAAWKQKKARARMNANARHGASKGDVKSAGIQ